jgi:hypothetical protein
MKAFARFGVIAALLALSSPLPAAAMTSHSGPRAAAELNVPNFNVPAAQLRTKLDTTLAEHAFLLGEAMRAGLFMGDDFEAVGAALEDNSADLVNLIAGVYGAEAGKAFGDLWRSHVAYLIDYTRALADGDTAAQDLAEHQLHTYVKDFSAFLTEANPNLPQSTVEELIGEHVAQLEGIAAFKSADYDKAYPALHHTYMHMFDIGDALSEAIAIQFPKRFRGKSLAFSPAGDLRIALEQLLGEHTTLAVTAMRAGVTESEDRAAAKRALDANTTAITAWMKDVYGPAAGDAFDRLWTEHTDAYLAYVQSTVAGDASGQQAALARLHAYQVDFSRFLAGANPKLSAADLKAMLEHHTNQLIAQADAYADGDYAEAYRIGRETFRHAVTMADALALAVAAQFPDRFPDTRVAEHRGSGLAWLGVLLLVAALVAIRPKERAYEALKRSRHPAG